MINDLIKEAVESHKIIARTVRLDSETATELLEHADTNRDPRPSRVARYRADMLTDRWVLNGEPIIISSEGHMIDGQHRCLAIQGTDAHVETLVVAGVPPGAMSAMGQGIPRTAGDFLGIEGEPHARVCAAISRYMLAYNANDGQALRDTAKPTNAEVIEYYRDNRDAIQASASLVMSFRENIQMLVAPSVLGFCHTVLHAVNGDDSDEFITQVAKGELLTESDAAFVVRTRLLNMGRSGVAKKASVIFTGWNAYRQKRVLRIIKVSTRLPRLV